MIDRRPHNAFSGVIEEVMLANELSFGNQAVSALAAHPFDQIVQMPDL